jgi:PKD repeat protein
MRLQNSCSGSGDERTGAATIPLAKLVSVALIAVFVTSCGESGGGSLPPISDFSFEQVEGTQTVLFTADGDDLDSIEWDFDDERPIPDVTDPEQETPESATHHTFCRSGEYEVRLTVAGPGGENSVVKTVIVDPLPGAVAGSDFCAQAGLPITIWVDVQPNEGGMDGCLTDDVVPESLTEKLEYGQVISWSDSSPCRCLGIELDRPNFSPPEDDPECVNFYHVAPDGELRVRGENTSRFAQGLEPLTPGACDFTTLFDTYHNTLGLHSVTARHFNEKGDGNGNLPCGGEPTGYSAVRQFVIVE